MLTESRPENIEIVIVTKSSSSNHHKTRFSSYEVKHLETNYDLDWVSVVDQRGRLHFSGQTAAQVRLTSFIVTKPTLCCSSSEAKHPKYKDSGRQ